MSDDKRSHEEQKYIDGRNAALRDVLVYAAKRLGVFAEDDLHVKLAYLIEERSRAAKALREIGAEIGCDEWPEDLDLGDVVEKNIAPRLNEFIWADGADEPPLRDRLNWAAGAIAKSRGESYPRDYDFAVQKKSSPRAWNLWLAACAAYEAFYGDSPDPAEIFPEGEP